jgi:hypothetical protein
MLPRLTFSDRERPADIEDDPARPVKAAKRGEQVISGARSVAASDARPLDLLDRGAGSRRVATHELERPFTVGPAP